MEFDYIICGGGSAGCVLAARLTEDPAVTVCLIEAGGMGRDIFIRAPALVAAMVSGRPPIHNWALHTTPQPGLNGRRGFQPRGKALGGSSAINAMLYVRGHANDYNHWAQLGNRGWSYDDVLPVFRDLEDNMVHSDAFHGTGGELHVSEARFKHPLSRAFIRAAAATLKPQPVPFWKRASSTTPGTPRSTPNCRQRLVPAARACGRRWTSPDSCWPNILRPN